MARSRATQNPELVGAFLLGHQPGHLLGEHPGRRQGRGVVEPITSASVVSATTSSTSGQLTRRRTMRSVSGTGGPRFSVVRSPGALLAAGPPTPRPAGKHRLYGETAPSTARRDSCVEGDLSCRTRLDEAQDRGPVARAGGQRITLQHREGRCGMSENTLPDDTSVHALWA